MKIRSILVLRSNLGGHAALREEGQRRERVELRQRDQFLKADEPPDLREVRRTLVSHTDWAEVHLLKALKQFTALKLPVSARPDQIKLSFFIDVSEQLITFTKDLISATVHEIQTFEHIGIPNFWNALVIVQVAKPGDTRRPTFTYVYIHLHSFT